MTEPCSSRRLSWLVRSCLRDDAKDSLISTQRRPRAAVSTAAAPVSLTTSPIDSLPDDLLLECLSRVPFSSLPSLTRVSLRFAAVVISSEFRSLRRSQGLLSYTLHALSFSPSDPSVLLSATLPINSSDSSWQDSATQLGLSDEIIDCSFSHARVVSLGRHLYLIGRGATLRYDTWTGVVAACAATLFPRKKFAAASVAGKIYVAGGSARTSAVEEYDPEIDTWRVVAECPRRRYGCIGAVADGVFYVAGGLRVGGPDDGARAGRLDAHVWAGSMDGYDVVSGAWMGAASRGRSAAVPGGGCVVGACGAGAHVYVVASHAVEVSFWRREGGEWTRLEPPPIALAGRVGIGGAVRFSCCSVGETRIVAIAHVSSHGTGNWRGIETVEGAVLVYDIASGAWSRAADIPPGFRRAAIACVEC